MIARLKKFYQAVKVARGKIKEGRLLLVALDEPAGSQSSLEILNLLDLLGLGQLRAAKARHDAIQAAREMDLRIQQGPRPSRDEAGLN